MNDTVRLLIKRLQQVSNSPVIFFGIPLVGVLMAVRYLYLPSAGVNDELVQVIAARESNIAKLNEKTREIHARLEGREEWEQKMAMMVGRGVDGESQESANSQLARVVTESCTSAGMSVVSYNGATPKQWEGRDLLGVSVSMEGQTENLVALLTQIREKLPDSRLQSLQVQNVDVEASRLAIQLELHALYFPRR